MKRDNGLNYYNAFITISDDCPVKTGTVPTTSRARKTVQVIQYEILSGHPYEYTQEDVLFMTYIRQNDIKSYDETELRKEFFSRPKPCLRSSPLPKKYGWGFHFDSNGNVAIYGAEMTEYKRLSTSKDLMVLKAMRSKKADA